MSDEVAFVAINFLIQSSRHIKDLTILSFDGEPMKRFDFIQQIIPYANKKAEEAGKKISWDMTTNGTLIDGGYIHIGRWCEMDLEHCS